MWSTGHKARHDPHTCGVLGIRLALTLTRVGYWVMFRLGCSALGKEGSLLSLLFGDVRVPHIIIDTQESSASLNAIGTQMLEQH